MREFPSEGIAAFRLLAVIVVFALLGLLMPGCAHLSLPSPHNSRGASCARFLDQLDGLVARHGVTDEGTASIAGFPELRADRFLASFASPDLTSAAYGFWVERLRRLGETARLSELRNLPAEAAAWIRPPFALEAPAAVRLCGRILAEQDQGSAPRRTELLQHAKVPDAYSTWMRVLGFYPLTRWAVLEGVWRLHGEMRQPFLYPTEHGIATGHWIRYGPPAATDSAETPEIARILAKSADNPLRIPEPAMGSLDQLFAAFAPTWVVETAGESDRLGMARFATDGTSYIDIERPAVYRLASHARMDGRVLLQLNYLVWFPARPPSGSLDIYAGDFDGLIWRVTLSEDGKPLAYDSIHPCGCYYQIFPGEGMRVVQPQDGSEPILSPAPIPRLRSGERLAIRVASRTHFIQAVTAETDVPASEVYVWRDYDELRSLPLPKGGHHSLFGTDGLLRASERPERFLLWPMGVSSAGAMRQWGTLATAFVGRRHFDDPRLLQALLRPIGR